MADGNTHGFDCSTLLFHLRKPGSKIHHLQDFPTRQAKTMFTGVFLFRKVLFRFGWLLSFAYLFWPQTGSIIVANGWYVCRLPTSILDIHSKRSRAILHDPEIYPDPEEFKPERFLDKAGSFRDDPTIALAFGAGRRICPGRHLVDVALFIIAASVLSVFNVTKAKDENGHEIPLRVPMTTGNLSGGVVV